MAGDQEQFDDGDEAQLAWLLTSAHDAPPLRGEFVRELAERLDAEFAAARGEFVERNGEAAHAMNGAARKVEVAKPQAAPNSRQRRRWVVRAAVAASLMMAVAVWADPPVWAAVFRAIVRGIGELTGGADDPAQLVGAVDQAAPVERPQAATAKPQAAVEPALPVDAVARSVARPSVVPEEDEPAAGNAPPIRPTNEPLWEPQAQDKLSQTIDEQLAALWLAQKIHPAGPSSDAEFMRRVYLDLTGRVPSPSEAHEFLDDQSPDRREKLVDQLLAHRDHATHLAAVWRQVLIPDDVDLSRYGGAAKFEEWLAERFATNVPYDRVVRDLLLAEGRVSEPGPLLFYAALRLNPEELAARSSRAFLGVRMECAQCHDHPFDDAISQHDFWSFAAFFARISRPRGKMEMTSPVLAVRDNQQGDVTIPDSDEVVRPRLPQTEVDLEDAADGPSRRKELADWLTSPNNGQFARATVNRVWSQLFGRGLVEPVDDMRPDNMPIAPEVLDALSRDFAASKFDLRRLLRAVVLTNAYQLSSRSEVDDPSRALYFAQMNVKSFTAEQLYDCIAVATQRTALAGGPTSEGGLLRFGDMDRQSFLQQFRAPPGQATDYHAGIPQALTLMHGGLIHGATDLATSGILKSLTAPFFTDEARLDVLFLSTLSRYPEPAERELMLKAIVAAKTDEEKQQALGDVLWALLNSAEFTFNH
jgi:hypothetical protein